MAMNALATSSATGLLTVSARRDVSIRVATMADLPFLDAMQKQHGRALGYFPTKQFEGYIEMGAVLVAHDGAEVVGYVISRDRYLKRDELGVVYQLCVKSGDQRKLVGGTLVREVFERSAYGCKLYCCWCAQDLPANRFWESMGFVPIAFRAGSTGKRRVHIFWQRRINDGDVTTPYWYPSMTNQGAIREDRLVFPIPPGTHWTQVQAVAVPASERPAIEGPKPKIRRKPKGPAQKGPLTTASFSLRFGPAPTPPPEAKPKPQRPAKEKIKIDPKLIAKARELRDRYLEQVNDRLLLAPGGKYDVSRALQSAVRNPQSAMPCLPCLPAA
jgi:ribosomal protein S18 acetylase RimI-like enzyme